VKTNELRKTIKTMLSVVCPRVYYAQAEDNALFSHIVFNLSSVDLGDINRGDYALDVDIWTKSQAEAEDMADSICDLFNAKNAPQVDNLPTFYLETRLDITDEDKSIKHKQVRLTIQNYERT